MIKTLALFYNFPYLNYKFKKIDGNLFSPLVLGWLIYVGHGVSYHDDD